MAGLQDNALDVAEGLNRLCDLHNTLPIYPTKKERIDQPWFNFFTQISCKEYG